MAEVIDRLNDLVLRDEEYSGLRGAVLGIYREYPSLDEHDCFLSHVMFCIHKSDAGYSPRIEFQQVPLNPRNVVARLVRIVDERDGILYKEIEELTGEAHLASGMFGHLYSKFLGENA